MKSVLLGLTICCLPILSSCSSNPVVKTEYIYIERNIPYSLLEIECKEAPAGDTVRSLAHGYVKTRSCLRAHQALIESIKKNYSDKKEGQNEQDKTVVSPTKAE